MKVESFAPIATPESRILILGTMPSTESIEKTEYYAHPKNLFWDIIYRVCNPNWDFFRPVQEVESYSNKVKLLNRNNIALWDILKYCDRKGNLDKHIRNEIKNDIQVFLKDHKNVSKILFNGLNAHKYFLESNSDLANGSFLEFTTLNSTSSSNSKNTFSILNEWKKAILKEI